MIRIPVIMAVQGTFSLVLEPHFQNTARLFDINRINAGSVNLDDRIIAVVKHRFWQV